ncbi:MAG: phosphatidate cytidylyltransferase [Bacillus sp. (in: Bacteria)]|nr:phosphatidate cytidylyltransferase [Bacillus sp. (in: firmicutes)]MCM1425950.1 phosphatidate cytidylyltransferase [Eubacterium sp.]
MFRTRLLSGIVLVILAFAVIWAGGLVMAAALCVISMIAYSELTKATGVHMQDVKANPLEWQGLCAIVIYYAVLYGAMCMSPYNRGIIYCMVAIVPILTLLTFLFQYVFTFPAYRSEQVMAAFFEFIYAPVLLSFLYIIREGWSQGFYLVWLVFLCSWGSDTCAYCVGVLFGKHKMTPILSPKKSVEGAIGGVVGAAVLFGLYTQFVINPVSTDVGRLSWVGSMALGALGALVSMVGDLAASAIKRDHDIKDYGKLIPGHGGIMDRFDSVIVAAPLIFWGLVIITV